MFDFIGLYRELRQTYWTEGKNVRIGNVNIACPFCDDHSNHLGGTPATGQVYCWRCGSHSLYKLLKAIGTEKPEVYLKKYGKDMGSTPIQHIEQPVGGVCQMPEMDNDNGLHPRAIAYLAERGYDALELEQLYGIQSTGPVGEWKFRIMVPIYRKGQLVSYLGRDYTGQQDLRYKTASREQEAYHHKDTLYGIDAASRSAVLVVEGVFDAWRFGWGAVATFGTSYRPQQVLELVQLRKPVFVLYDNEPEARVRGNNLVQALLLLGVPAQQLFLPEGVKDPAELTAEQVREIRAIAWKE